MLVDTGAILALVNRGDSCHAMVVAALRGQRGRRPIVPMSVLPEVDYLITKRYGPHVAISALNALMSSEYDLEAVTSDDLPRIVVLMRQYADANIGFVDASIVAIAERLGVRRALTLDRRHFGPIRPSHCEAFDLVP